MGKGSRHRGSTRCVRVIVPNWSLTKCSMMRIARLVMVCLGCTSFSTRYTQHSSNAHTEREDSSVSNSEDDDSSTSRFHLCHPLCEGVRQCRADDVCVAAERKRA